MPKVILLWCAAVPICLAQSASANITLVDHQSPRAVVVTADQSSETAAYAAQELVGHVERATGVRLSIVTETKAAEAPGGDHPMAHVYVGATQAARKAGIDPDTIPSDATVLRTIGDNFYIVGHEGPGKPLDYNNVWSGTLWGVYEFLDRDMGVRWIFPGEAGIYVPKTDKITVSDRNEQIKPRLVLRELRETSRNNDPRLGFTDDGRTRYLEAERVFLRRLRMGRSDDPRPYSGHSFTAWWGIYGRQHPEWFQQRLDGQRGPGDRKPGTQAMCVSNPEFEHEIVTRYLDQLQKNPSLPHRLSIGENDTHVTCDCPVCREWDGPQPSAADIAAMPHDARGMYYPFNCSNRYARYWKTVYDLAHEVDPNVFVTAYAYSIYSPAPTDGIKLNPNIVIGFCLYAPIGPDMTNQRGFFFPRHADEQRWSIAQWDGWHATGATLFYRPNFTLDGYTMPHVYTHQLAQEFQHVLQNGCIATNFDSLVGQWAAQGPTMYVLVRLHSRPDAKLDDILDEYYKPFGPAAPMIREYFDYWEKHTTGILDKRDEVLARYNKSRLHDYPAFAFEFFPASSFQLPQEILDRAAAAARADQDPIYAQRVAYVQDGLTHALLCIHASEKFANPNASAEQRRAALDELVNFRHAKEGDFFANFHSAVGQEVESWKGLPGFIEVTK